MASGAELVLLVTAQSEVRAGVALASQLLRRNRYTLQVLVTGDSPDTLIPLVTEAISSQGIDETASVQSGKSAVDELVAELNGNSDLRLLLVPGLDQWNDTRKTLMRQVHATVACFETHPDFVKPAGRMSLLGKDHGHAANWLCERWSAHPILTAATLQTLDGSDITSPESQPDDPDSLLAEESQNASCDILVISVSKLEIELVRKLSRRAIDLSPAPVVVVRGEISWLDWFTQSKLPSLATAVVPQMTRETRRTLSESLTTYSKLDFEFIALICAATFLASFGLVQNSAAVIIGAMLVAPLMTPLLGAGLSLAQGNRPLFASSLRTIAVGFLAAMLTSLLFGCLLRILPNNFLRPGQMQVELTSEMWSRTTPTLIDCLVGLVGGFAAAFARTRHHLSSALAGAAIAAALVPPIATAGLQLSLCLTAVYVPGGGELARNLVYGPALLFVANMLTIMIGSSILLWACGVRGEHGYSISQRWSTRMVMCLMTLTALVAVWILQHP